MRTALRIVVACGLFAVIAVCFLACRGIVGIQDRTVPPCGSFIYEEASCATCMEQSCCGEGIQCSADAGCDKGYACLARCAATDATCRAGCLATSEGNPILLAARACDSKHCALACNDCGGLLDEFGPACDACVRTSCCNQASDCAADPTCNTAFACLRDCVLPDCMGECINGANRGPKTAALQQCLFQNCSPACQFGADWHCVGNFSWGASTSPSVTITATVTDLVTGNAVPGATVDACGLVNNPCTTPNATATSGADGVATLVIPIPKTGVGFIGHFRIQAPGAAPTLIHPGRPFVHDEAFTYFTVQNSDIASVEKQFNAPPMPNTGIVFASIADCRGQQAPDVTFSFDGGAGTLTGVYFDGFAPGPGSQTTRYGAAAFLNVAPGNRLVTATLNPNQTQVGSEFVIVEAGAITQVQIDPAVQL